MKKIKRITAVLLAFTVIFIGAGNMGSYRSMESDAATAGELTLCVGSPLILADNKVMPLDSQNPSVTPLIRNDRTLVPLRTVSEQFGADVSYDNAARAAIIKVKGQTYTFPVDEKYFIDGSGEKQPLDVGTFIIADRSEVPLRAIAEQVFGHTVSYYDSLIVIGSSSVDLQNNKTLCNEIRNKIGGAVRPQTEAQLKAAVSVSGGRYEGAMGSPVPGSTAGAGAGSNDQASGNDSMAEAPSFENGAMNGGDSEGSMEGDSQSDFTGTNIQEKGVDEGDVFKTDGKYLYYAVYEKVHIVDPENMSEVCSLKVGETDGFYVNQILLSGNRMAVIGENQRNGVVYEDGIYQASTVSGYATDMAAYYPGYLIPQPTLAVYVYDISNVSQPVLLRNIALEDNWLVDTRNIGNTVYLIAQESLWIYGSPQMDEIVPHITDSAKGASHELVGLDDIFICPGQAGTGYTTVLTFDMASDLPAETESFLGDSSSVYMSANSLYLIGEDYPDYSSAKTEIIKISVNGTSLGFVAEGSVEGSILNQFSLSEYNGYLRIATNYRNWSSSSNQSINSLYVMDSALNNVGTVADMAPGESIYAVRFMENTGYVVTYEQTDPLFVIDLTDPANPSIAGQLKVPGFSNYLHPVGNDLLLGIGRATEDVIARDEDGKEQEIGTRQSAIKMSLFDVSNPQSPQELDTMTFGSEESFAEVLDDHHALLADGTLFGFTIREDYSHENSNKVVLVDVKNNSLSLRGESDLQGDESYYYSGNERLCRIGNNLYVLREGGINKFNVTDLSKLDYMSFS